MKAELNTQNKLHTFELLKTKQNKTVAMALRGSKTIVKYWEEFINHFITSGFMFL